MKGVGCAVEGQGKAVVKIKEMQWNTEGKAVEGQGKVVEHTRKGIETAKERQWPAKERR